MKKAVVTERCLGDPICFARLRCPSKAIKKSNRRTRMPIWFFRYSEVDRDRCVGCGNCVKVCLHKAISLVAVEEYVHL
jgi:Pyruvate/2-oxoacid:ferredoxin oxidoreductase delta subunit